MPEQNLASLIGVPLNKARVFGVEIEVEGNKLPTNIDVLAEKGWHITRDGSLRGDEAYEYVTSGPMSSTQVTAALTALDSMFKTKKSRVDDSIRAAIHLHINVSDLTPRHIFTFLTAYYVFEDLLIRKAGVNRDGNLFALPLSGAYGILPGFVIPALREGNLARLRNDDIRYAAMNLRSMFRHGTLEFRPIGTKAPFKNTVLPWMQLFTRLLHNSEANLTDPSQLITLFSDQGAREVAIMLLGQDMADEWIFCHQDWSDVMMESVRLVQDYVFVPGDWSTVFQKKPAKRKGGSSYFDEDVHIDPAIPAEIRRARF